MSETIDTRDYRDTVFLPNTPFPMRGDLPRREPETLVRWADMALWDRMRADRAGATPFILHDGPPYANGHLHIGHALNKILKDVINRAQRMAGRDANYIPGWDCHGLPIEWKIEEEYRKSGRDKDAVPILQFRAECRAYAAEWMATQAQEFWRLGISGDWDGRYATMDFKSEASIAAEIGRFLMNGSLYRGLRPVMWSTVEKTALAEAEVEYHDRTSDTVYVRVRLKDGPGDLAHASAVYWTTTPWTVAGTRAVTLGPDIDYSLVRVDTVAEGSHATPGEMLLVARALLPEFAAATGVTAHTLLRTLPGSELLGLHAEHPLARHPEGGRYGMALPFVPADYVTDAQGTGFVPNAPAHGEVDFAVARAHGVEVPDSVAPDGRLMEWTGPVAGVHVFKSGGPVSEALAVAGTLLARGTLQHSYPHSWRSKAPLIWRATPQWFIRMDGPEHIRDRALAAIDATRFVPDRGRNRIGAMVADRPDWCISRQRAWGVPIPVFVERATGEPLRDPAVIERVVEAFAAEGADCWYSSPPSRFLGEGRDPAAYEQVQDIVDVWFESGSSHAFTLEARGLPWPADLYLEGSDQHRGWFQASLLEAVGTRGVAPFRAVLTHGFVLDEQGRKMSKSLGNVTAPQEVCDKYGADILRLWVMSSDTEEDLRIGPEILKQQAELYRRLRNTLRWLLGALEGFTPAEALPEQMLPELERFVLHRLAELSAQVSAAVATHDWSGVYPAIHSFCSGDLSAFYFDVRKDALYCDRADSVRRRAVRTTLDHVHRHLCAWLAPVLVFTAEEAWVARFGTAASIHLGQFPEPPAAWQDEALALRWATLRSLRRLVTERIEVERAAKKVGSSLQAHVRLGFVGELTLLPGVDLTAEQWAEMLIVSSVTVSPSDQEIVVTPASGEKCARCWRVLPEVGENHVHPALCRRCVDAVEHIDARRRAA